MKHRRNKDEFKKRVLEWADKLGVQVRSLAVRPMSNKWASCSVQGNLNFNVELVTLDRDVGDYVIVHELLHFFVPMAKLIITDRLSRSDRVTRGHGTLCAF